DRMMLVVPIFRGGRPFGGPRPDDFRQPRSEDFSRRGNDRNDRGPGPDRPTRPERLDGPVAGPGGGPGPIDGPTVIELGRDIVLKELVPALAEKHFSPHDQTAYRIAVVAQGVTPKVLYSSAGEWTREDVATPDKSVNLFAGPRQPGGGRGRGPGPR